MNLPSKNSAQPVARTYQDTKLRRDNREQNIAEYRAGKLRLDSRPLALFVELTQSCNLECPMCRFGAKYDPSWNVPLELFERVAEELFPTALVVDIRCRGASPILKDNGVIEDRYAPCRYSHAQRYVDSKDRIHPDRRQSVISTETALALTARRDPATTPGVPWM